MSYNRIDRISEEVRREIDRIIREDVNDPRTKCTFSITHADVTRDLRYGKIYVSVLEDDKRAGMMEALKKAPGDSTSHIVDENKKGTASLDPNSPEAFFETKARAQELYDMLP